MFSLDAEHAFFINPLDSCLLSMELFIGCIYLDKWFHKWVFQISPSLVHTFDPFIFTEWKKKTFYPCSIKTWGGTGKSIPQSCRSMSIGSVKIFNLKWTFPWWWWWNDFFGSIKNSQIRVWQLGINLSIWAPADNWLVVHCSSKPKCNIGLQYLEWAETFK